MKDRKRRRAVTTVLACGAAAVILAAAGCGRQEQQFGVTVFYTGGGGAGGDVRAADRPKEQESQGTTDSPEEKAKAESGAGNPGETAEEGVRAGGLGENTDPEGRAGSAEEDAEPKTPSGIGAGKLIRQAVPRLILETERGFCQVLPAEDGFQGLVIPAGFVKEALEISVLEYPDSHILLQQGGTRITLFADTGEMAAGMNRRRLGSRPCHKGDQLYLPLEAVCEGFGYRTEGVTGSGRIRLKSSREARDRRLPKAYDYRDTGRSTRVRDQGSYGTCWSFASLTAIETALRPGDSREFSADHMSLHNSFSLEQRDGGEYTMAMAYLLAWQGPVAEEEDPYGDQISPEGLKAQVHVQEIQILPSRDYRAIKKAVFLYGGVQSSLYTSITSSRSRSVYYKKETSAYCYQGQEVPNHDVVIVGWDDGYPKENFQMEPEGDGAFLCVSSWGEDFGQDGYFYVSYYDSNIGGNGLVYSGIESAGNYGRIYQSDLCGWVGQVGYGFETAWGAGIYEAEGEEILKAAGFYATGEYTEYEIFLVRRVTGTESLKERNMVARGNVRHSGFYTVPLETEEKLEPGERFALVIKAVTPGAVHPMAVEYQADDATAAADVTDGESYISLDGTLWESLEEKYQCNLCLKGYTDPVSDGDL